MPVSDKPTSTLKTCWAYKTEGDGGVDVCINTCITTPPDGFATLAEQSASHKLAVDVAMDPEVGNPPDPSCRQPVPAQTTGEGGVVPGN